MKKILALLLLFTISNLNAKDIETKDLQEFSTHFKAKLKENSYTGLFCYVTTDERRIFGCEDFNKRLRLGDSSNIITNYLAFELEKQGKFDRNADLKNYAKIFKYDAKNISFADLISSRALIAKHLDNIYPKDALEYEYFDFLRQLNPNLLAEADYEFSKISNLGAIYALSYSQSKNTKSLMEDFKTLVDKNLKTDFPSLELSHSENNLDISFSLSLKDLSEYLAREIANFSAKSLKQPKKGSISNAWLFTELGLNRLAMVAGQKDDTFIIANFYDRNVAIAIFLDGVNDEKARNFVAFVLQDFAYLLNR